MTPLLESRWRLANITSKHVLPHSLTAKVVDIVFIQYILSVTVVSHILFFILLQGMVNIAPM